MELNEMAQKIMDALNNNPKPGQSRVLSLEQCLKLNKLTENLTLSPTEIGVLTFTSEIPKEGWGDLSSLIKKHNLQELDELLDEIYSGVIILHQPL